MIVAGTLGFAKGIDVSGAGALIAEKLIGLAGPLASSDYFMTLFMLFLATLLSNFMSNNSAAVIVAPIAFAIAASMGSDPLPSAVAIAVGSNQAVMTPICTANITMTTVVGYRFKDYIRFGGLINVIAFVCSAAALYFVYFL